MSPNPVTVDGNAAAAPIAARPTASGAATWSGRVPMLHAFDGTPAARRSDPRTLAMSCDGCKSVNAYFTNLIRIGASTVRRFGGPARQRCDRFPYVGAADAGPGR